MPMKSPGSVSKMQHADHGRERRDEVRAGGDGERATGAADVEPVEGDERPDVDELDERGDHDRGERRLGKLLEQPGEEQERDDGQGCDHDARELGTCARAR